MKTPRTWIMIFCLSGMILSGQSQNSWTDMDTETYCEAPGLETADVLPKDKAVKVTALQSHVSTANPDADSVDEHHNMEAEEKMEEIKNLNAGRRKRNAWWKRQHAYRIAGMGPLLMGWRKHGKEVRGSSALMGILRELYIERSQLMGQEKKQEEEDDDDDDDDDDSDEDDDEDDNDEDDDDEEDDEEEENEEEENEEEEGEEEEVEEEKEEEGQESATEAPINQTESPSPFTETPVSGCQTADREIRCRGIGMTHLPIIYNLEATKLDVAENNLRGLAAQTFSGLPNLDTLDLSKNQLHDESFSELPLSNLTSLKKLNLDGNQLTRIPTLLPQSLAELKLNKNKLTTLTPDSLKGLMNLLTLELRENILHEGSVSLLTFKPLKKVLKLQLDSNRFRSLPLGLPPSLQELVMKGNQILEMTDEPLRGCSNLKVLDLSHNLLHEQSVNDQAWHHLKSLEALDLSDNQFSSVPMNLPRHLQKLNLQHNSIRHIQAFTFRHLRPSLQFLSLSHNLLTDEGIERQSFVGTFHSLRELLLDNNRLREIPHCIRQFKNLQVLRLDNNQIRLVRQWGVCHPQNSGSTLMTVHLENNYLKVENVPPKAFSCLVNAKGLFL